MDTMISEENQHLQEIQTKLHARKDKMSAALASHTEEYEAFRQYMVESVHDIDPHEMFVNSRLLGQLEVSEHVSFEQLRKVEALLESAYFGRIDFKHQDEAQAEPFYIGKFSFTDDQQEIEIYDWRAPISGMYYDFDVGESFYESPIGRIEGAVTRKRQLKIVGDSLDYVLESDTTIHDDILQKELSQHADEKMKSIIGTIQKEQNQIIRDETADTLIIQGVAGSGKTSIALHRIAFLLYRYRETIHSHNIVILSPNQVFGDFISHVLPELGEEPIKELESTQLVRLLLKKTFTFETYYQQVESSLLHDDPEKQRRIRYKSSPEFVAELTDYLIEVSQTAFQPKATTFGGKHFSKTFLQTRYVGYQRFSIKERFQLIAEDIIETIKGQVFRPKQLPTKTAIVKKLFTMFEFPDTVAVYKNFYAHQPDLLQLKKRHLEYNDVFPLLYVQLFFEGIDKFDHIKYLVIDEMQDYTPIQYQVFAQLFKCRKTILGDFSQKVTPYNGMSLDFFDELFPKIERLYLSKSYRSTYEIMTFAKELIQDQTIEPMLRHGEAPQRIVVASLEAEVQLAAEYIHEFIEKGYASIGILTKNQVQAEVWYHQLTLMQINCQLLTEDSTTFHEGVTIASVQSAKGLEFDGVIGVDMQADNYSGVGDKYLQFIIATRAMHQLVFLECR